MHSHLQLLLSPSISNSKTMFRLCVFFLLLSTVLSELCNPNDKKVLLQIKKDLSNPYLLASWDPTTDCCKWYCVECHPKTHRIISLNMFADGLAGQIPPSVGDLQYLETLDLHKLPNLTGPIQPTIAKLTNLKFLRLDWTNLSGPIPDFFSELKNLTYINLSYNNLSGSIPASLSQLPHLGALSLSRNKLTGPIPDSFGSFAPDFYLSLSHNQLSGTIPASLGNVNFTALDLSRNKLQGDASMFFGSRKNCSVNRPFYELVGV